MRSCLYEGRVVHRRRRSVEHRFSYSLFLLYLDLSELEDAFRGRWLWSIERRNIASFSRRDHLGDPEVSLDRAVRDLVDDETGRRPEGAIRILTHLRYFGCCMNPVSFYYCWSADDSNVEYVVAEINNTPWGERHCYVVDRTTSDDGQSGLRRSFEKEFHVSPFLPMNQIYDWSFSDPCERIAVRMENLEDGKSVFDATLTLERRELSGRNLARALLRFPLMTVQVVVAIYWQALRLWLKRCPFHPHPKHGERTKA